MVNLLTMHLVLRIASLRREIHVYPVLKYIYIYIGLCNILKTSIYDEIPIWRMYDSHKRMPVYGVIKT